MYRTQNFCPAKPDTGPGLSRVRVPARTRYLPDSPDSKLNCRFCHQKRLYKGFPPKKSRRESSQTSFAHSSLILDPPRHWIGSYFTPRIRMKIVFFGTTPDVFRYNRQTNICSFQRNCSCGYLVIKQYIQVLQPYTLIFFIRISVAKMTLKYS